VWRGLAGFEGRCSIRAWFFVLARNAAARFRQSPHRRPGRTLGLSAADEVAALVRSTTERHLQTGAKDRFAAIRRSLSEDDRALLVLRIDRGLSWVDVTRAFAEDDSDEALKRVEARLRKRFELLKKRLRAQAAELFGSRET